MVLMVVIPTKSTKCDENAKKLLQKNKKLVIVKKKEVTYYE